MEPEYIPLYTRARDRDRSPTGTHLHPQTPHTHTDALFTVAPPTITSQTRASTPQTHAVTATP